MNQYIEAESIVESLLQAHRVAIEQVRVSSSGRYWIHQQSCGALASTYKQALPKLTSILTEPLLSLHGLNPQLLHLLVQPALDMVLAAILQGKQFLETCRPSSVRHSASTSSLIASPSASSDGEDAFKFWLHRALLKGHATDAIDVHLRDFLIAFSAVGAAIDDLNARITTGKMTKHSANQAPLPADLFWREQSKPHVLLVSAEYLDHVKHADDTFLNTQIDEGMKLSGYRSDDASQISAFVKEKIRCSKQAFDENIDPGFLDSGFLDIQKLENDDSLIFSDHLTSVHKVMCVLGREFALKVYKVSKEHMEIEFLQEAKIQVRLHHPNVVHAVAVYKGKKEYGILMERMDESLKSFLQKARRTNSLKLQDKVSIMLKIAKGMAYVHERGVIHRDLKPSNVLVRINSKVTQSSSIDVHQQLEVKVTDFGESSSTSPDSSSFKSKRKGTSVYRAPEVLNDNIHSSNFTSTYKRSADVYSFAMTCFELLVEKEPFEDSAKSQALWDRVIKGERPDRDLASISDAACPPYLKHCLQTWWANDPKTRHSFKHICCILRHIYACLARCPRDTEPIKQFPFLTWPYLRWRHAQDIAQQSLDEFEERRAHEDWKVKGNLCKSTRVNEIPYELHVMNWAIKKAADDELEEALDYHADEPEENSIVIPPVPAAIPNEALEENSIVITPVPAAIPNGNRSSSTAAPLKSFGQKLKEFCRDIKSCCCSPQPRPLPL